jgi:hypothetical protein
MRTMAEEHAIDGVAFADRVAFAERIAALRGVGKGKLALKLRTTVRTLDRIVCDLEAAEATYCRIRRRLELLERQVAAEKSQGSSTRLQPTTPNALRARARTSLLALPQRVV